MEFDQVVRRRRMVRSFSDQPVDPAVVDALFERSLGAPSAGNTGGTAWVVLECPGTAAYWEHATTPDWRRTSRRYPGLRRAPVVAVSLASPEAYLARYGEPDKAGSGLGPIGAVRGGGGGGGSGGGGGGADAWPVPYWFGDAAFATLLVLLGATDAGLGACFLGAFRGQLALLAALGVPDGWQAFGAVVLGHPDGRDHPSASLRRPRPSRDQRIHRGRWSAGTGEQEPAAHPALPEDAVRSAATRAQPANGEVRPRRPAG